MNIKGCLDEFKETAYMVVCRSVVLETDSSLMVMEEETVHHSDRIAAAAVEEAAAMGQLVLAPEAQELALIWACCCLLPKNLRLFCSLYEFALDAGRCR